MSITSEDEEEGSALLSDTRSDDLSDTSTSDVSDGEGDGDEPLPPPPFSHTFAPPFYGRPPTPLPPSPSLTSLLRPSRPTTPDASDDDLAAPVPRATPRVPTYEYYGFVLYLFSSLTFLVYLLWSFLPSPFLHALGIYYYPNRWWALAIPSFLVMTLCYIYVALAAYNTEILTLPLGDIETIVDEASKVAAVDAKGRIRADERRRRERRRGGGEGRPPRKHLVLPGGGLNWKEVWNEGTDAVMDIPLAGVCEVLYGDGREDVTGENGNGNGNAW
jgi:phosphatidylinositol N-acetylglucosaminyltransferase subunit P